MIKNKQIKQWRIYRSEHIYIYIVNRDNKEPLLKVKVDNQELELMVSVIIELEYTYYYF